MTHELHLHRSRHRFASKELWEIFFYEGLKELAFGLVGIYVAVYLYTQGLPLYLIVAIFAVHSAVHGLSAFFFARGTLLGIGLKHTFIVTTFLFIGAFLAIDHGATLAAVTAWILFDGIGSALYASAHHSYLALTIDSRAAGKQYAVFSIIIILVDIVTPFVGGVLIFFFGFGQMLLVGSGFLLLSVVPLFFSKEIPMSAQDHLRGVEHIRSLWKNVRPVFLSAVGNGLDGSSNPMWDSLYIYKVVKGIRELGALSSILSFVQILSNYLGGKWLDENRSQFKKGILGSIVARILTFAAIYPAVAVMSETLNSVIKPFYSTPYNAGLYKRLKGPRAVSHVVAHESLWHVANVVALTAIGIAAYFFGWYAFLLTGVFMILGKLLVRSQQVGV